jgi:bifunctional DNase/RNase
MTTFGVAIALVSAALAGCSNGNPVSAPGGEVIVEVTAVRFDQRAETSYVQLDDRAGRRSLEIAIGADEARTITLELRGIKTVRPLTNELLGKVIARTGNAVDRIEITEVRDETYYAKIILDRGRYAIDSRPSDAIALALGVRAPIYVASSLMRSIDASATEVPAPVTATNFGVTVQELTADLVQYFGVEAGSGVVIADLNTRAGNAGLQRGDIVIEAGGHLLRTPEDFAHVASPAGAPIELTIRHDGATRTVTIAPAITSGG